MCRKINIRDIVNILMLLLCMGIIITVFTKTKCVYGSTVDWESQHYDIPEYFRQLFYQTKQIIPSFAPAIGAGQNIYYFSYYGLFSPVILISYLLPFVSMMDYIIVSSIILVGISVVLVYIWLRQRYNEGISLVSALCFLCAGPLLFHSHRHIMFINYMPFLILALICIDNLSRKRNIILLPVMVFLIIMTSYYFSFSSLIFLTVYAAAVYMEKTGCRFFSRAFMKQAGMYIFLVATGIMMAGILLLPTAYALFQGRGAEISSDISQMVLPGFNLQHVIYSPYSVGVPFIGITAFMSGLVADNIRTRILSVSIVLPMIFSVFIYLLNGTLYVDGKVLIPFLPIAAMLIAELIRQIIMGRFKIQIFAAALVWVSLNLIAINKYMYILFCLADFIITGISIVWVSKKGFRIYRMCPVMITAAVLCIFTNSQDTLVTKETAQCSLCSSAKKLSDEVNSEDSVIFRTSNMIHPLQNVNTVYNRSCLQTSVYSSASNKNYHHFFFEDIGNETRYRNSSIMSQSSNILFDVYMGNKYLISTASAPAGYKKIKQEGDAVLYENDNVFPLAYSSAKVMSLREYEGLGYAQKAEAVLKYAIVDDDSLPDSGFVSQMKRVDHDYQIPSQLYDKEHDDSGIYMIENKKKKTYNMPLKNPIKDKILFIRFHVDNSHNPLNNDVYIKINQVKNKLTVKDWKYYNDNEWFEFVISSGEELTNLDITVSEGTFTISDLEAYTLDYSEVSDIRQSLDVMSLDEAHSKGDIITGTVDMKEDGVLQLSVPYDNGFQFYVDSQKCSYEKVDTAFIGTYLTKGKHEVTIRFRAPLLTAGKMCSCTGIGMLAASVVFFVKRKHIVHKSNKRAA
ncbi:MAG: YfhO family protein [Oscillospiraceae bacterium]|nr:YfhO family protein [Oscillospiraceae bacterium]